MSEFYSDDGIAKLLSCYGKIMMLKIFVDDYEELKNKYTTTFIERNKFLFQNMSFVDAGIDLFAPDTREFNNTTMAQKIDYNICCSATIITDSMKEYNTGFYLYPRSSLSSTPLRLANSVGIIDSGYIVEANSRQLQICAPDLIPIVPIIVNRKEELGENTIRGDGGFGSTGF